jgi:Flp pilus assembly protein TadG
MMRPFGGLRRLARAEAGSALAEMAVIGPVLVLLLIGLIELGRYAQFSIVVGNAARAGVQYGAQNLGTAANLNGMAAAATNDAQNIPELNAQATQFCQCADGTASACQPTDCAGTHQVVFVQVDANAAFRSMLHFPGVPATQTIKSRAVMRVAQ